MGQRSAWILVAGLFACTSAFAQPRDPLATVLQQTAGLSVDQRKAKLDKLAESPFRFFRGTAYLFWSDLGDDPGLRRFGGDPGTRALLIGDAHPENVGTFGHDRAVYDLDDFDEAVVADYQLDLWRMGTGLELVGRSSGVSKKGRRRAVRDMALAYAEAIGRCSGTDRELSASARPDGLLRSFLKDVQDDEGRKDLLRRWTEVQGGARVLDTRQSELEDVSLAVAWELSMALPRYASRLGGALPLGYFRVKSVARRLDAGTGSLGAERFYVLIEAGSSAVDDDVILDVKQQGPPAAAPFLSLADRALLAASFPNEAARVAAAERALLGAHADRHIGWLRLARGPFSVRQRSPFKATFDVGKLNRRSELREVAAEWGRLLALAHARADRDSLPALLPYSVDDAVDLRVRHQRSGFARAVAEVADRYADQVEDDHERLERYVRSLP